MVTGRMSFVWPLYSPIASPDSVVLSMSSAIHWRVAVTLVVNTRVEVCRRAMHARPTMVFPAPQGNTITPEPPRAGSRCVEGFGSLPLIIPQVEAQPTSCLFAQDELKLFALAVACQVFDGIADLNQGLLQPASLCRFDKELARSDTLGQEGGHSLMTNQFLGEHCSRNAQHQIVVISR